MTTATKVRASVKYGAPTSEDMAGMDGWTVTLRYQGRQLTVPFYMGPALCREPEADEVLECLLSDASSADEDFESWASDLGYDTDSRKAERIYRAVQAQTVKLRRFLGDDFEWFLYDWMGDR